MDFITLDFSSSYRAITDADIRLALQRNILGFDGGGIPMRDVVIIDQLGNETTIPGGDVYSVSITRVEGKRGQAPCPVGKHEGCG
jgi:hypothetical protein